MKKKKEMSMKEARYALIAMNHVDVLSAFLIIMKK